MAELRYLGKRVSERDWSGFDVIPLQAPLEEVTFRSDEVTARCPFTGQPDFYTVEIVIVRPKATIESKSLKLFLQKFREEGTTAEDLASTVGREVAKALRAPDGEPLFMEVLVKVTQKPRGGISIEALFLEVG